MGLQEEWDAAKPVAPVQNDLQSEWDAAVPVNSEASAQPEIPDMPWYQNLAIGAGKGLTDVGTGALQRILEGGEMIRKATGMESNQPNIDRLNAMTRENREAFAPLAEKSTAANVGEFIGGAAPLAAIPGGVAGSALRRAGTSALSGAATGLLQPTTGEENPLQNAAMGAAMGGATSGGLSLGSKAFNALSGRLPENIKQALAKRYGIRTTLGEVTNNPITGTVESWLERVPIVGLRGFREKQQQEANTAAKTLLSKYMVSPDAPNVMAANRAYASGLYDKLRLEVAGIEDQFILPNQSRLQGKQLLERYPDLFKKFQDTQREKLIANVVDDSNQFINFKEAWTLRDGLGDLIGQAKKKLQSGDVDRTQLSELSKLYSAINNDIDTWANSIGRSDVRTMINEANDAYKNYVVKSDILQRAYSKATSFTSDTERFSPQKFSTALYKTIDSDRAYNLFQPQEIEELAGLANIMHVVRRSGQYMENPPTGNRWGPLTAGGGIGATGAIVGGMEGAIKTGGGVLSLVGLTRFLTTTEPGKKLAMAASRIDPENPNMKVVMKMIYNNASKWAALGTTDQ